MARRIEGEWMNRWCKRVTGKGILQGGIEEAPGNGKESSHSAHDNGIE
jgi:hypothetical protein